MLLLPVQQPWLFPLEGAFPFFFWGLNMSVPWDFGRTQEGACTQTHTHARMHTLTGQGVGAQSKPGQPDIYLSIWVLSRATEYWKMKLSIAIVHTWRDGSSPMRPNCSCFLVSYPGSGNTYVLRTLAIVCLCCLNQNQNNNTTAMPLMVVFLLYNFYT